MNEFDPCPSGANAEDTKTAPWFVRTASFIKGAVANAISWMKHKPAKSHKVEVYKDARGEFRWRRIAPNGQIVAVSGEGYKRADYCEHVAVEINLGCWVKRVL